jgi:hypothetical protein
MKLRVELDISDEERLNFLIGYAVVHNNTIAAKLPATKTDRGLAAQWACEHILDAYLKKKVKHGKN